MDIYGRKISGPCIFVGEERRRSGRKLFFRFFRNFLPPPMSNNNCPLRDGEKKYNVKSHFVL